MATVDRRRSNVLRAAVILSFFVAATARADGVYRLDPPVDIPVTAASYLTLLVGYSFAADFIRPRCPCNSREINAFDRGVVGNHSDAADLVSTLTVVGAVAAPAFYDWDKDRLTVGFFDDAVVLVETLGVNAALVTVAKDVVQRPLPRTYAGDPALLNSPGGYRSFYSGHTSTAFAALGYLAYTLRLHGVRGAWPWILDAVVGTSVAAERVLAGRHFYTDVIVGAAAGALVGWAVPALHRKSGLVLSAGRVGENGVLFNLAGVF